MTFFSFFSTLFSLILPFFLPLSFVDRVSAGPAYAQKSLFADTGAKNLAEILSLGKFSKTGVLFGDPCEYEGEVKLVSVPLSRRNVIPKRYEESGPSSRSGGKSGNSSGNGGKSPTQNQTARKNQTARIPEISSSKLHIWTERLKSKALKDTLILRDTETDINGGTSGANGNADPTNMKQGLVNNNSAINVDNVDNVGSLEGSLSLKRSLIVLIPGSYETSEFWDKGFMDRILNYSRNYSDDAGGGDDSSEETFGYDIIRLDTRGFGRSSWPGYEEGSR